MTGKQFISGTGSESLVKCYEVLGWPLPPNLPSNGFKITQHSDGRLYDYNGPDGEWGIVVPAAEYAAKHVALSRIESVCTSPLASSDDILRDLQRRKR